MVHAWGGGGKDPRVHAWGGGWDLRSRSGTFFFFFFKNDTLFSSQSRTEDLTHNVRGF